MKRLLAAVFVAPIVLGFVATVILGTPLAGPQGKGQGRGGGGGGSSEEVPVTVTFRTAGPGDDCPAGQGPGDDDCDRLRGDFFGPYSDGAEDVSAVLIATNASNDGNFDLDFGKKSARTLRLDLGWLVEILDGDPNAELPWANDGTPDFLTANLQVFADNAATDCDKDNLQGGLREMVAPESEDARIALFIKDPEMKRVVWKLSWTDPGQNSCNLNAAGTTKATVTCEANGLDGKCAKWTVRPGTHPSLGPNLAALKAFKGGTTTRAIYYVPTEFTIER